MSDSASDRELSALGVPASLRDAAAAWAAAGRPRQGASEFDRAQWLDAFPEYATLLVALPERLNRSETRRIAGGLLGRGDVVGAFLVSQIWGYGLRGYGPYRVGRILGQSDAADCLRSAYETLVDQGPVAAFGAFADSHRIAGLGPAFFTKFMFFADPSRQALVLDEYVGTWLQRNAAMRVSLYPPRASVYREYLTVMESWAAALQLATEDVEQLIFAAEALTRPRNDWLLEEPS